MPTGLLLDWIGVMVSTPLLGASVLMLWRGTPPPPLSRIKVSPLLSTSLLVVSLTGLLVFGNPDLLKDTIDLFSKP